MNTYIIKAFPDKNVSNLPIAVKFVQAESKQAAIKIGKDWFDHNQPYIQVNKLTAIHEKSSAD